MSGFHECPDLNKARLAEFLDVPESRVTRMITGREIPFYWAGNHRDPRVLLEDAVAYRNQLRTANRVEPDMTNPNSKSPISVVQPSLEQLSAAFERLEADAVRRAAVP